MDQPFYWDNALLNPADAQTLPDYILSPSDLSIDYWNEAPQASERLSIWTSLDPNAGEFEGNQGDHDESKMEDGWNTTLSINSGGILRTEDQHFERSSMLSLENMGINLNSGADEGPSLHQTLNASQSNSQSAENNAKNVCKLGEIAEIQMHHYIPEFFEPVPVPSSNSDGSSSIGVGLILGGGAGGLGSATEGQRVACKRKNIERVIGESSASANTLFFLKNGRNYRNASSVSHNSAENSYALSSSKFLPIENSLEEQLNPCLRTMKGGISSECDPRSSIAGNAETSQRNFRVRLNPEEHDISRASSFPTACNTNLSRFGSHGEPSYLFNPLNHHPGVSQLCIPPIPCLPDHVFPSMNGASSSRGGSSSNSGKSKKSLIDPFEDENMRSIPKTDIADHRTVSVGTNSGHLHQCPPNGNLYNSSLTMTGNLELTPRASSSSGINSFPGLISVRHEIASVQYSRSMSEIVFSPSVPSHVSESGCQSSIFSIQRSAQSPSLKESLEPSGVGPPGPPGHTRPTLSVDRQRDGMAGMPLSIRNREGRDRMISEIRNALDLMRRGENLRFEDAFIRDHSAFFGRVDLHDRHRDMRLDVDNMSYEDLLALQDRIGYVNTGLSEDIILKNLRQNKHSPCKLEVASAELEPCCICREEYSEGEDIGTLNCSHDFHTACIKQWLMIKNLCPICKTTALAT